MIKAASEQIWTKEQKGRRHISCMHFGLNSRFHTIYMHCSLPLPSPLLLPSSSPPLKPETTHASLSSNPFNMQGGGTEDNDGGPWKFLAGTSKNTWKPVVTADTTTSYYWINWRVLLCAIWVLLSTTFALFLIFKYEGYRNGKRNRTDTHRESIGSLYDDETWKPCLKGIHPAWLLVFRLVAFFVLLVLLLLTAFADGGGIFYFYTQWTFTLITVYFGLGSVLSIYGCYKYHKKVGGEKVGHVEHDAEQGDLGNSSASHAMKTSNLREESLREPAGFWGYLFQIIFQMNAGAVMLTDCVFWFILVPFLAIKDYNLNFLIINMHTVNAVFLLGDAAFNCLRFPWFRIGYFFLWTIVYVLFQWVVHACVSLWWPYPFLDLSSPYAPLWYFSVAVMHIPCYGVLALLMKLKHHVLLTRCPQSNQCRS